MANLLTTYRAIVCPYCRDVVLLENFPSHAHMTHDVKVHITMTEEEINKRFAPLGGVIYGDLNIDSGKFKPHLTSPTK